MRSLSLAFTLSMATLQGACQIISIQEVVWTNAITSASGPNRYHDSIPLGQVGVWVKANCHAPAWETVQSTGHLPIRYKWYKRAGAGWSARGADRPDDFVDIDEKPLPDSIRVNASEFYWHSWCLRKPSRMSVGIWKVVITTTDNERLAESEILVTRAPHD